MQVSAIAITSALPINNFIKILEGLFSPSELTRNLLMLRSLPWSDSIGVYLSQYCCLKIELGYSSMLEKKLQRFYSIAFRESGLLPIFFIFNSYI